MTSRALDVSRREARGFQQGGPVPLACLQRYVSVLARRALDRLAQAKLEAPYEGAPGLARLDDVVDVAALRGHVRVGEAGGVLVHQLLPAARQVTRHVDEGDDRDPERIAEPDEARRLYRRVDVDRARQMLRLVADDADDVPSKPAQADHDVLGEEGLDLEELAVVEDAGHK